MTTKTSPVRVNSNLSLAWLVMQVAARAGPVMQTINSLFVKHLLVCFITKVKSRPQSGRIMDGFGELFGLACGLTECAAS